MEFLPMILVLGVAITTLAVTRKVFKEQKITNLPIRKACADRLQLIKNGLGTGIPNQSDSDFKYNLVPKWNEEKKEIVDEKSENTFINIIKELNCARNLIKRKKDADAIKNSFEKLCKKNNKIARSVADKFKDRENESSEKINKKIKESVLGNKDSNKILVEIQLKLGILIGKLENPDLQNSWY